MMSGLGFFYFSFKITTLMLQFTPKATFFTTVSWEAQVVIYFDLCACLESFSEWETDLAMPTASSDKKFQNSPRFDRAFEVLVTLYARILPIAHKLGI